MSKRLQELLIPLILAFASVVGGTFLFASCHPSPAPIPLQVSASVQAHSTSQGEQWTKIHIPVSLLKQKPNDTQTPKLQAKPMPLASPPSLLKRLALVIHPAKQATVLPAPVSSSSATVANNATVDEEIVIEMGQNMASSGGGQASASAITPNCLQNVDSSIGIIAGTMPGIIALDWRVIHLGSIGLDLAANHRSVSAGISAGGKIFGLAGGYQAFDGSRGIFAGAGVRF